jgi:transposase
MPRVATKLECSDEEISQLKRIVNSRTEEIRKVERAKIILQSIDGKQNIDIAEYFNTTPAKVGLWRNRFAKDRLAGLNDLPRSGKPATYTEEHRNKILLLLKDPPPEGQAAWDGGSLAKMLGYSDDAVWRLLRKDGIQLQRQRTWCVSTDPEFSEKSANIIGLYLNPPENAIVISVDEKPSIQTIEREMGYVKTSSGKVVRGIKSTYKRNGTINLFAALQVATGIVHAKTTATKTKVDFLEFMDDVVEGLPKTKQVHVILDNYSTHKNHEDWLARMPMVKFHYTPTSASWLNQVEIWFGILTRKALKGASFSSTEELVSAIEAFTRVTNSKASPFIWTKREVRGSQLKNTIGNLCN